MSTIDEIMSQAQEFASGWSIVGGRFDSGDALEIATESKAMLRNMITAAMADARRDGAEAMRSAAAKLAGRYPLYDANGEEADEVLVQAIEDLPLPDVPVNWDRTWHRAAAT